eukprot:1161996-Pelagomonas_calceolata.AAC.2
MQIDAPIGQQLKKAAETRVCDVKGAASCLTIRTLERLSVSHQNKTSIKPQFSPATLVWSARQHFTQRAQRGQDEIGGGQDGLAHRRTHGFTAPVASGSRGQVLQQLLVVNRTSPSIDVSINDVTCYLGCDDWGALRGSLFRQKTGKRDLLRGPIWQTCLHLCPKGMTPGAGTPSFLPMSVCNYSLLARAHVCQFSYAFIRHRSKLAEFLIPFHGFFPHGIQQAKKPDKTREETM